MGRNDLGARFTLRIPASILLATVSLASMSATPSSGTTTTIDCIADSYIRGGSPNANDGDSTILRVRKNGPARTLVHFDQTVIAATVGSGTLNSATLRLNVESATQWSSGRDIDIHRITKTWTESLVTWLNADAATWNTPGADFTLTPTSTYIQETSAIGIRDIDVKSDVDLFLAGTEQNFGWLLKKRDETQGGGLVYTSRDASNPANRPKLILDVSPSGTPPTPTSPPTATATPILSFTPTEDPTPGPFSETCNPPSADNPKTCDKISTFPLRSLRDWATCLERVGWDRWGAIDMEPPDVDGSCGVYLADGGEPSNMDCNLQSPLHIHELEMQSSNIRATCDLERGLHHCDLKLLYQETCNVSDWNSVEYYLGGSINTSPNYVEDPDDEDAGWKYCMPWQRETIFKTINDVWLPFLAKRIVCLDGPRIGQSCMANEGCGGDQYHCGALPEKDPPITPQCGRHIFKAMAESLDDFISQAGDDDTNEDKKAFWRCEGAFDNTGVKNNCNTCNRAEGASTNGYVQVDCPGVEEQITMQQWDDLCKFLKARYNPFRQACRQQPGDRLSGPNAPAQVFWEIEPTPTAIP